VSSHFHNTLSATLWNRGKKFTDQEDAKILDSLDQDTDATPDFAALGIALGTEFAAALLLFRHSKTPVAHLIPFFPSSFRRAESGECAVPL